MLDSELIRHHRNEFGVRRLGFRDINRISENKRNAVDVAARPSDFNRVADSAFDAAMASFYIFQQWLDKAFW